MSDGTTLGADLYRPSGPGAWPTILVRTPYDRSTIASRGLQVDAIAFAEAGYSVVVQDVRGRYASEGEFEPFVHEQSDGVETIRWLVEQPWCDGRVGMAGLSYLGFCQLAAAAALPESLVAIAPGLTVADVRDGWFAEGGVFNFGFNLAWILGALLPADPRTTDVDTVLGAFDDPFSATSSEALVANSPLASSWAEWQRSDPYGDHRSVPNLSAIGQITIPSLVVAGWFDVFQPATFDLFEALPAASLVAGPWGHTGLPLGRRIGERDHGRAAQLDMHGLHRTFFDQHLRDADAGVERAAVFVTGDDRWERAEEWPPQGTLLSLFDEQRDRVDVRVVSHDPTPPGGGRTFGWEPALVPGCFDQSDRERRPDVATFTTAPLSEALFVAGPIDVVLECDDNGGMVFVVVSDVDLGDRSWNVADGVAVVVPGLTEVGLGQLAHVFERGHRVRVSVSFGAYPRYRWEVRDATRSVGIQRLHVTSPG